MTEVAFDSSPVHVSPKIEFKPGTIADTTARARGGCPSTGGSTGGSAYCEDNCILSSYQIL